MLSSWPALSTLYDGDWIIRLADGYTKRANSVTCLGNDATDLDRRIDRMRAIYEERGQPAIFRLSPLSPPALDRMLEDQGWYRFDETIVMMCPIAELDWTAQGTANDEVIIQTRPDATWLKSCQRMGGADHAHLATFRTMLERLIPPAAYARIGDSERIDAMALIVVDADLAGLFELLTRPERRGQGLAGRLLRRLFAWSGAQGAETVWLSVLAHNTSALQLYRRLGFREIYRYHHRANREV